MSWLNELIQPPPDPEANRWIQVTTWQVAVCEGNVCAAAILAYFFARHYGKLKHVAEGKEDNAIAVAHKLQPRRGAESLWFRATDRQIEAAIFFFKRRSFPPAIEFLKEKGFVSKLDKNPNPAFAFDRSRYFKLNVERVQEALFELFGYGRKTPEFVPDKPNLNPLDSSSRKNAHSSGKFARSTGETAQSSRKTADNSNELNSKGFREAGSPDGSPSDVESKNDSTSVSKESKLELKAILEGQAELPAAEGVEPDEALLEWLPVAVQCSRAGQALFAFTFWKLHHRHPRAIYDTKRKKAAEDRLKAGYTLDRLCLAIRGVKFSAHHMGLNPRSNPDNRIYDDFGLILKDGKQVETFEALALQSDEADRKQKAEAALASNAPPVPTSRFTDAELEDFAKTVADMLAQGYEVSHLRVKFNVGKTLAVADWTRILELAAQVKGDRDSRSMNGNGAADDPGDDAPAPDRKAAKEVVASLTEARGMPYAREEDFD